MTKFLVEVEFRYAAYDSTLDYVTCKNKTVTVGVFESNEEAIEAGGLALEEFEKRFPLNQHYNVKQRFGSHYTKRLITNLGYILTPFSFFARIVELHIDDVGSTIDAVLKDIADSRAYEDSEREEEREEEED